MISSPMSRHRADCRFTPMCGSTGGIMILVQRILVQRILVQRILVQRILVQRERRRTTIGLAATIISTVRIKLKLWGASNWISSLV
jgi:type IV secretory pathway VirB3-like protein